MGDPRKRKKKYSTPIHPWNLNVIEAERQLKSDYGLGKKREILIANSFLKKYKDIAKKLIATKTAQAEKEQQQVLSKLQRLGLLSSSAQLDQILGLELKDILERRVQSLVFRKNLARSMKQARQFIVHRHVKVGDKEITSPSTLLSIEQENSLSFKDASNLADENHPERAELVQKVPEVAEEKPGEPAENVEQLPATPVAEAEE